MSPHFVISRNPLGAWGIWYLVPFAGYAKHTIDNPEKACPRGGWPWLLGLSKKGTP